MTHDPNPYYKAIGPPPDFVVDWVPSPSSTPDWRDNRDPEHIGNKLRLLVELGMKPSEAAEYI